MPQTMGQRILVGLKTLRPRWAWIALALGLPWLLTPLSCSASASGCLGLLSALSFWTAALVLGAGGLRWMWRRLLFRVNRRLWVIILLLSLLPAAGLTVFFVSLGWMVLGGQASRSLQGEIQLLETGARAASREPSDSEALRLLAPLGQARVLRVPRLPKGPLRPGFVGLVRTWNEADEEKELVVQAVTVVPGGFRIVQVDLGKAEDRSLRMWSGRVHYHLAMDRGYGEGKDDREGSGAEARTDLTWSRGKPIEGSLFFHPFRLPGISFAVVDSDHDKHLTLRITPETSLAELFAGYGFDKQNIRHEETVGKLIGVGALLLLLGTFQGLAMLVGLGLVTNLGRSINDLARGVARLTAGDYRIRIRQYGQDQVAALTTSFNTLAERLDRAAQEREERLRLEEELRVAREVQMRLLPDLSALGHAIRATILPAREVAGDYFDALKVGDSRYAFLIADVSGKGTSAAFYAAETKGVLSALDKGALGPREILDRLNAIWCRNNPRSLFMTAIYGLYDTADGSFSLVRAGHPAAYIRRADGSVERLAPRGIGIGLSPTAFLGTLQLAEGRLEPGASLVCCTDGLTEALSPSEAFFGESGLEQALRGPGTDTQALVLGAVETFVAGRPLDDDLTLLVIQR